LTAWSLALLFGTLILAQPAPALGGEEAAQPDACCAASGKAGEGCKEAWKVKHREYMEKMAERDARLDELVATMNAAGGDEKVDAMAAVLNELISQRNAKRQRMQHHGHGKSHACPSKCSSCAKAKEEAG
jgi:hypothetical protein